MALPMLVGGADCGPINPLQGLSKELDRDRGLQQDHFGAARAGSSKQAFRSQYSATPGADQDAARFFAAGPSSAGPSSRGAGSFDLAPLHGALPALQTHTPAQSPHVMSPAPAPWAADFLQQQPRQSPLPQTLGSEGQQSLHAGVHTPLESAALNGPYQARQWTPSTMGFAGQMNSMQYQAFAPASQVQQAPPQVDASQWEQAFKSHEAATLASSPEAVVQERQSAAPQDFDELARAAGSLIDAVRHEQNPKFQNSAFLGLMKQLRDHEVVVEGDKMVPKEEATSFANDFQSWSATDAKGKGRALDPATALSSLSSIASTTPGYNQLQRTPDLRTRNLDENDAYIGYWHGSPDPAQSTAAPPQAAEWDRLQYDWDRFEATATGIRAMANYQFQAHNPYLVGETSSRHHLMHTAERNTLHDNVLEMEAAVQRRPTDAHAWFQLGVKQQENEREGKAIQALRRALELDPSHLPSWLALAVSHTNEGNRAGTYEAIREWVSHNERYRDTVTVYRAQHPETEGMTQAERFNNMIDCLITMARNDQSGDIDADIQIALAVLMNTNEAYEKAKDCFTTALAVRPDDWQLYNRVGATLANSGRAAEALDYYYRALELNPAYIRARFNLGISCINLRRYSEASQHILDALSLQEADSVAQADGSDDKRGITSAALWDSLKTCCLHLGRLDLATLCDRRELDTFQLNFNLR